MKPRSKTYWIGTLFLVFLAIAASHLLHSPKSPRKTTEQKLFQRALESPGISTQAHPAPRINMMATASTAEAGALTSKTCDAFNEQVETLPLRSLLLDLKDRRLRLPAHCESDPATQDLFEKMVDSCSRPDLRDHVDDCEARLFQYRARRIQLWSEDQNLKSLSTDVLIQKFFGLLAAVEFTKPTGSQQIRDIAQELKIRLPESAAPYRMEVVSYLTSSDLTSEENQAYTASLREARQRDPNDWQLYEIQLFKSAQEDPAAYHRQVRQLLAANPSSPIGLYHAGCISWKDGNRQEARKLFHQASLVSPNDKRIRETIDKTRGEDSPDSVCSLSISFTAESF